MKIAIQGHSTRGHEVIQILESLGGKNTYNLSGKGKDSVYYYHIDNCGIISFSSKYDFCDYEFYTLEEFEKEFPFKIGNEVIFPVKIGWASGKVTGLTYVEDQLKYEVYVRIGGYYYVEPHKLQLYPMKKERNITLTLDKAQEWYKKGGELKEIALQAYSEEELTKVGLPKSWEEYCKQGNTIASWRYDISVKYDALIKLEQLRNCWRQGWEPNWDNVTQTKYYICCCRGEFKISTLYETRCFLTFPTREMAREFLECFRDLIEKAGDLI